MKTRKPRGPALKKKILSLKDLHEFFSARISARREAERSLTVNNPMGRTG